MDNIENFLTTRQVIQSFVHLISERGPVSQDNITNEKIIYFHLLRFRAKLISEKLKTRSYNLSKINYQNISCVKLEEVDFSECNCAPISGCTLRKTLIKIPTVLHIESVTSVASNIKYNFIQFDRLDTLQESRFQAEKTKPYYTFKNTGEGLYLYILNSSYEEFISITAIFEDPNQVYNFPNCKTGLTDPCFSPLDSEFILDPDLLPIVYDLAYNSLFRVQNKVVDLLDDKNDPETQSPIK